MHTTHPTADDLLFLPLGGSGEIGMNLNLYGHNGKWLMVDCGVTFNDRLGVEVIMPDVSFIEKQAKNLAGLVLTHAHEDHIGAVAYLWRKLKCPLYATPFTATLLRQKLKEGGLLDKAPLHVIPLGGSIQIADFSVEFVTLTHSIPEPNALLIKTPLGSIFHTGDWKIDPQPLVGEKTDEKQLKAIGDEGVLAMVCDSTNVFTKGESGSEGDVRTHLEELFSKQSKGRLVVGCFASNIARVETIIKAAQKCNRQVALVGLSLQRMFKAAKEQGYMPDIDSPIDVDVAMKMPREKVVLISTGSQGEFKAGLTKISHDVHPYVKLDAGDVVIFSSRVIPGNEKSISALQNRLVLKDIEIITANEHDIHVSGHPARDELKTMYSWIRPEILVPVHGEARHMREQARLGLSCGIKTAVPGQNGVVLQLAKAKGSFVAEVDFGRLGLDGKRLVPMNHPLLKERNKLSQDGALFLSLTFKKSGQPTGAYDLTLLGLNLDQAEKEMIEEAVESTLDDIFNENSFKNPAENLPKIQETIRIAVRRTVTLKLDKKPLTVVHCLIV